jgi:membrane protein
MSSGWGFHGQSWRSVARRVWADIGKDKIFSHAAELAYYFLLALFPLLLFLTSVIGVVIGSGTRLRQSLFAYLGKVLPGSASQLQRTEMK